MAPRRRFDRAPLDSRSYREPLDGRIERYDFRDDRYDARDDDVRDDRYSRGYDPREAVTTGMTGTTEASTAPPDPPNSTKTSLR